jgi:hypothetical protein
MVGDIWQTVYMHGDSVHDNGHPGRARDTCSMHDNRHSEGSMNAQHAHGGWESGSCKWVAVLDAWNECEMRGMAIIQKQNTHRLGG